MTISDYVLGMIALVSFVSAAIPWPKDIPLKRIPFGLACLTAAWLF